MNVRTARRPSRGYLLSWLGSLVGFALGMGVPLAAGRGLTVDCDDALSCGVGQGFLVGMVVMVAVVVGISLGVALGPYIALRTARRPLAGLTAFAQIGVCASLYAVSRSIGAALEGSWLDAVWTVIVAALIITSPLIARHAALRLAACLRKYQ